MSLEMYFRIYYNDSCSEHVEIGEDSDGLGMVELRYRASDGKITSRINLNDDMVLELIAALTKLREFRENNPK